jgi:sarcosine oxidase subunit beta
VDGLIIATGFSGHGFAIGPGVASLLTKYLTTGKFSEMLAPFTIERFGL